MISYRDIPHELMLEGVPHIAAATVMESTDAACIIRNDNSSLSFTDGSRELVADVLSLIDGCNTIRRIAQATGFSSNAVASHLVEIADDGQLYFTGFNFAAEDVDLYLGALRLEASVLNSQIFLDPLAKRIFAGEASQTEVKLWGIEFYRFVAAANEYMPLAISRLGYIGDGIESIVQHFLEESPHDDIFRRGLSECGISADDLDKSLALAGTRCLVDHLYETSGRSTEEYLSLFAVMQAKKEKPSLSAVQAKYSRLRERYLFASGLFRAFEEHDTIDAELGHSEWVLEHWVRSNGMPPRKARDAISSTMKLTSDCFRLFYRDIERTAHKAGYLYLRARPAAGSALTLCD